MGARVALFFQAILSLSEALSYSFQTMFNIGQHHSP